MRELLGCAVMFAAIVLVQLPQRTEAQEIPQNDTAFTSKNDP